MDGLSEIIEPGDAARLTTGLFTEAPPWSRDDFYYFVDARAYLKAGITSAANSSIERIASSGVIVPNAKSQTK